MEPVLLAPVHEHRADRRAQNEREDGPQGIEPKRRIAQHQPVRQLGGKPRHVRGVHVQDEEAASIHRTGIEGQQQPQRPVAGDEAATVGKELESAHVRGPSAARTLRRRVVVEAHAQSLNSETCVDYPSAA